MADVAMEIWGKAAGGREAARGSSCFCVLCLFVFSVCVDFLDRFVSGRIFC